MAHSTAFRASPVRQPQLRDLLASPFLREMRHFLWIDPSVIGAMTDPGWSCRDHAWLTALLAHSLGHDALLVRGEAFFVRGAAGDAASVSGHQSPHGWVYVEGVGAIDLSTRSSWHLPAGDYNVPIDCVFADTWIPRGKGKAYFVHDPARFSEAIGTLARQRNRCSAVYRIGEAEELHEGHVTRAAGWIRSPLALRLDAVYGNPTDLYCALLLHLRAFLEGRAPSLAALPQEKAWTEIARDREGAIGRVSRYFDAPADVPSRQVEAGNPSRPAIFSPRYPG